MTTNRVNPSAALYGGLDESGGYFYAMWVNSRTAGTEVMPRFTVLHSSLTTDVAIGGSEASGIPIASPSA